MNLHHARSSGTFARACRYDPTTRMESLEDVPISAANAKQRRGRAGRCRPGVAFHLVTKRTMQYLVKSFTY